MIPSRDPTARFSDRVEDYARYRPGYPVAMVDDLVRELALGAGVVVADVGSGTGLSSEPFLSRGFEVFAIEPNHAMRAVAEQRLRRFPRLRSIAATAETTTLADGSVDVVAAGQAFHWFDRARARAEFVRILRPGGSVVLFWNVRDVRGSEFLLGYEALLQRYATDYREVDHRNVDSRVLAAFFGGPYVTRRYPNEQWFDLPGVIGRLCSSSYTPPPGHPDHRPMLDRVQRLFHQYAEAGRIRMAYSTEVHVGALAP